MYKINKEANGMNLHVTETLKEAKAFQVKWQNANPGQWTRITKIDKVSQIVESYGGPDPSDDPEWWFDTSNFDGDPVDLF